MISGETNTCYCHEVIVNAVTYALDWSFSVLSPSLSYFLMILLGSKFSDNYSVLKS